MIIHVMPSKDQIQAILKTIPDPELGISVWDLGLIYGVEIDEDKHIVTITMTLTTLGCPLFSLISDPIKELIGREKDVKEVVVDLTFEPPWNMDRMTDDAKAQMGFA